MAATTSEGLQHVALTVSDLQKAKDFFQPVLAVLGYRAPREFADPSGRNLIMNVHPNGTQFNLWPADEGLKDRAFETYAPGLHHVAFSATDRDQVNACHEIVRASTYEVKNAPGEFYDSTYYAFYFLGPDEMKFEVVHRGIER